MIYHLSKLVPLRVNPAVNQHDGFTKLKAPCAAAVSVATLENQELPWLFGIASFSNELEQNQWKTHEISGECLLPWTLITSVYNHIVPVSGACQEQLWALRVWHLVGVH